MAQATALSIRLLAPAGRIAAVVLLLGVVAWGAGFIWFVRDTMSVGGADGLTDVAAADGIVALTGGAERVGAAFQLLIAKRAPRLLVSGVGHATDLAELSRRTGIRLDPLADQVTIGRFATTTRGNAAEAAAWAEANKVHVIIVVTASYHMRRALLEMRRAMPKVTLIPAPVLPAALRPWPDWPALRLIALEYTKWLVASVW